MRILILGASGLAGAEIRRTLDTPGNLVYGSCRNPAGAAGLCRYDLDGPGDLEAVLEETRPEAIVSCLRGDYEKQLEAHRTAGDDLAGRGGRLADGRFLTAASAKDQRQRQQQRELFLHLSFLLSDRIVFLAGCFDMLFRPSSFLLLVVFRKGVLCQALASARRMA